MARLREQRDSQSQESAGPCRLLLHDHLSRSRPTSHRVASLSLRRYWVLVGYLILLAGLFYTSYQHADSTMKIEDVLRETRAISSNTNAVLKNDIARLEAQLAQKDKTIEQQQSVIEQAIAELVRVAKLCEQAPDCEPGEIVIQPPRGG